MYSSRIQKIQNDLKNNSKQGLFVTNSTNIFYLTGFMGISPQERESSVLVSTNKVYLFIPAMYGSQAKQLESIQNNHVQLIVDHERDGLLTKFLQFLSNDFPILFESTDMKVAELNHVQSKTSTKFEDSQNILHKYRLTKDETEIEKIKKAVEITDLTFCELIKLFEQTDYTQFSELDIADQMNKISRNLGGEGFGFDPIVACGPGSAEPHYATSHQKLKKNQPLLMDFGIKYKGYTGDLTRCIYLGEATEEFKKTYNIVLQANQKALDACKAGITEEKLYEISNNHLKMWNLDSYFLHGLGHGVGLDIHEHPFLRQGRENILQKNTAITIEPGVYFDGNYGIRIEDLVIVKENGCDILSTKSPKTLIEIK